MSSTQRSRDRLLGSGAVPEFIWPRRGSLLAGVLSDAWGLETALAVMPVFGGLAALAFVVAAGSYEADRQRAAQLPAESADRLQTVIGLLFFDGRILASTAAGAK